MEKNPAFQIGQLAEKRHTTPRGVAGRTLGTMQSIAKSVIRPKKTIKSKATRTTASQLSKVERPYLSREADLEFLQAHDDLMRAESAGSSGEHTSDEHAGRVIEDHRNKVRELEAHRESLRAAWTTSRHVRRVKVIPTRAYPFPKKRYFENRDHEGNVTSLDWLTWIGYACFLLGHLC